MVRKSLYSVVPKRHVLDDNKNQTKKTQVINRIGKEKLSNMSFILDLQKIIAWLMKTSTVHYHLFISGQTVNGSWWDHINGFLKLKNVLLISYEDLIEVRIGLKSV